MMDKTKAIDCILGFEVWLEACPDTQLPSAHLEIIPNPHSLALVPVWGLATV